jgi:membrane fusion protein (multidrug efflux system)
VGARIDKVLVQDNQHVKRQLLVRSKVMISTWPSTAPALATREAERLQAQSKLTQQGSLIAASEAQVAPTRPAWTAHRST